ncbi:MAG: DUF4147 domain-containing protein [Anaerolineales bacterium]|nr:DUF4147 domain-containing protein [Anaerolineales bacterium]
MKPEQFLTENLRTHPHRDEVIKILAAAIQAVDPYEAVRQHLNLMDDNLHIGGYTYTLRRSRRIFLIGAGKAGLPMAKAAVDLLGSQIVDGVVIVKDGHGGPDHLGAVKIREAGHPVPDQRGISATTEILSLLEQTGPDDLVLTVISGGGSALMTAPIQGISLAELQTLTNLLLKSGAEIREINQLRRRLDRVKGGGLVQAAAPAKLAALILSDVVGDPLELIASGPTVLATGQWQKASDILQKYNLQEQMPDSIKAALRHPPPPPFAPKAANNILVGNNRIAAEAAIQQAATLGYQTELLTSSLSGEARKVGREYGGMLKMLAEENPHKPVMWVTGGETTVTVIGEGQGGRNQELALAAVEEIAGVTDAALISLATDGEDGPTEAAGAVVTGETLGQAQKIGLDPAKYLANNDSYRFFKQVGGCLVPGPTHTNVNDLLFLFSW